MQVLLFSVEGRKLGRIDLCKGLNKSNSADRTFDE